MFLDEISEPHGRRNRSSSGFMSGLVLLLRLALARTAIQVSVRWVHRHSTATNSLSTVNHFQTFEKVRGISTGCLQMKA